MPRSVLMMYVRSSVGGIVQLVPNYYPWRVAMAWHGKFAFRWACVACLVLLLRTRCIEMCAGWAAARTPTRCYCL
ncbi:hypothetical protein F4777DRAFT_554750 [Nemania sp. FL0916]|nr:hypothetical protein F4777DRAFT_554750 [Nemania sp. FL0916]